MGNRHLATGCQNLSWVPSAVLLPRARDKSGVWTRFRPDQTGLCRPLAPLHTQASFQAILPWDGPEQAEK